MECTEYVIGDDYEDRPLCRCPVCKGWLPRFMKEIHICKKCGTELISLPHVDEDTGEVNEEWGKICPISLPLSSTLKMIE